MIPQLAGLFLLSTLSACQGFKIPGYLEFIPGQYPAEPSLWANPLKPLSEDEIPTFVYAVKRLALAEESMQLIFRFFNRPSNHRFFLDYVLLIGNFNISDEGLAPYYKRKDGLAGFLRGLDDRPSTQFLRRLISDAILGEPDDSQTTEHDVEPSTDYTAYQSTEDYGSEASQSTEQDVGPFTEYTAYQLTEDYGSEASQSTEHEGPSTEYTAYQSTEDYGSEASQSTEHVGPSTEYTAYQSTEDYGSEASQSTEHVGPSTEYTAYQSTEDYGSEASQSTEHVGPSTEYTAYQSTEDYGSEASQSTEHVGPSTEYTAYLSEDYGSEAFQSTEHVGPSTEYTAYQLTEDYGSEASQSTEHEIKPSTEFKVYYSEAEDSGEDSRSEEEEIEPSTASMPYQSTGDFGFEVSQSTQDETSSELEQRIGLPYKDVNRPSVPTSSPFENEPLQVGSIRAIPGVHFPDYYDIPITSFSCADKKYIPGFYADLETGCQVFHVCWPHRRESFLCPVGTTFNQAILTCDYWYSTDCSLTPLFFGVNAQVSETSTEKRNAKTKKPVTTKQPHSVALPVPTKAKPVAHHTSEPSPAAAPRPILDLSQILEFLPVKSKVVTYPESKAPGAIVKPLRKHIPIVKLVPKTDVKALKKSKASQIIKEVLEAAESLVRNEQPEVSGTASVGYLPVKLVHDVKRKRQEKPIEKPLPLPTIIQRFVVKPASVNAGLPRVVIRKQTVSKQSIPATGTTPLRKIKPVKGFKIKASLKPVKEEVPEIVMRALEMAGAAFQRDILPFTRQSLIESYVKHSKLKKH